VIGFLIAGALADWSAKFLTKKNNGVYEPEFRIILVIPQLIFGCAGLYLFGVTASRLEDYSWVLPVFAFGLEVGGMVIGAVAASLYIVDAHSKIWPIRGCKSTLTSLQEKLPSSLSHVFSFSRLVLSSPRLMNYLINGSKNFFSFGLTWSAYEWVVHAGTYKTFMWISSIQVVVCLLSIPMCKSYSLRLFVWAQANQLQRYIRKEEQEFLP